MCEGRVAQASSPMSPSISLAEVTPSAWASNAPPHMGEVEYCETLEDKSESFVDGNELVPVLFLLDAVNTRATSLLAGDIKFESEL